MLIALLIQLGRQGPKCMHYCRKNNRGGRFPFSATGKRVRHGHKATELATIYHGLMAVAGACDYCG